MQSAHKSLTVSQGGKPLYTLNNENVLQQPPASVIKQHINLHWERLEGHEALSYECDVLTDPTSMVWQLLWCLTQVVKK